MTQNTICSKHGEMIKELIPPNVEVRGSNLQPYNLFNYT
jgi:hypothetical protein